MASSTPAPAIIRKVVISAFNDDPDKSITIVREPIQPPAKSEVQVAVLYAGFSGADVSMARGVYPLQRGPPLVPGYSMVGRVLSRGPGCKRGFADGDVVTALTVYDADADRINVDEKYLVRVPHDVELRTVPAMTLDWATAYSMVEHAARVRKGHRVFIHGLSGACGYATMALSLLRGAVVYGTASARNHEALRGLGVHQVFVYTDKAWIRAMGDAGGADAVFDPLGFESWGESYSILASDRPSVLVGYGGNAQTLNRPAPEPAKDGRPGVAASPSKAAAVYRSQIPQWTKLLAQNLKVWSNKRTVGFGISRDGKSFASDLEALLAMSAAGEISVPIKGVWDLEDVKDAHRSWGKAAGMGSMIIKVVAE